MIKRILVTLAAGALFAPLAFSQTQQSASAQKNGQKTAEQITVTGTTITAIEDGAAANYQPPKTLVVRQDRNNKAGTYALNGSGHIVDKRGEIVRSAIQPGARVRVFYTNDGDLRVVDHVLLLD